jgi:GTP cyclohydrolase I
MALENQSNIENIEDKNNLPSANDIDPLFKDGFASIRKIVNSPNDENQKQESMEDSVSEKIEEVIDQSDTSGNLEDDSIDESELDHNEELDKTPKKKKKLWQIKSQYYAEKTKRETLERQLRDLEAQKRVSDDMLQESLRSGLDQLNKNVSAELNLAKEKYKKALLSTDADGVAEANVEIGLAAARLNDIRNWQNKNYYTPSQPPPAPPQYHPSYNPYQDQYQGQYYDPGSYQPQPYPQQQQHAQFEEASVLQEKGKDWVSEHPYLKTQSKQFDPILYKKVSNYIDKYNERLQQDGRLDEWFSDRYFRKIDNYIEKLKETPDRIARNIESVSSVGGVRNHSVSRKVNNELTDDEKEIAKMFGISEAQYRQNRDK